MPTAPADWPERSRDLSRLLSRTALGDRVAFRELYERTSAHLFAVVLRINHDRAQCEDILQDVYLTLWRAAQGFDSTQSQPLTWLTSIARNRAIDSLRRRQAGVQFEPAATGDDEDHDVYDSHSSEALGPLELLARAVDARQLAGCIEHLSAPQRHSVALAFFDGCTHAEVAAQMGVPLGSVKSWLRRALTALKDCLDRALSTEARG
jgi:RNA polymerase sigma factor (sigma-70 family)